METNSKNAPTAQKLRLLRIAGALLVGVMIVAAGAADAKNGGGGGGGKGGGGGGKNGFDNGSFGHGEIIRELVKFSDEPQPQRLGGHDDDDDSQLRLPTYQRVSPKVRYHGDRDAYCHAKYQSYNSLTGKYTGYSGRKHYCVVP